MRSHGTLVKWNDERGFGFIQPGTATDELFVHISAFPRDGTRPRIGEVVSFEIDLREDGKKRAVRLMRPGVGSGDLQRKRRRPPSSMRPRPLSGSTGWIGLVLLVVIGYVCYAKFASRPSAHLVNSTATAPIQLSNSVPGKAESPIRTHTSPTTDVLHVVPTRVVPPAATFHCDGRKYCSQMTSCAEATYFLQQCPGTRMDGDHDGVACESQWCSGG